MDLKRYPLNSLARHLGRTLGVSALVALLALAAFGGSVVVASLTTGLASLEARLGADIIVAPKTAKSTTDLEAIMVDGVPGYFYMDKSYVDKVSGLDGVEKVSPQYYLATVKAGCCTMPVQIIGIDPETDFTIQPWIDHSYGRDLGRGDVVVGSNISGAPGSKILFYGVECTIVAKLDETGTALDSAAFCNVETIQDLIQGSIDQGIAVLTDNDPAEVVSTVQVKVEDGRSVTDVTNDINLHVRGATAVQSKAMTTGVADSMAGVARIVGALVVCVWVLAVAVLAIASWVLGRQRTKEFGVLRVLGARKRDVAGIVVREGALCALVGGAAGIAVAGVLLLSFSRALEAALGLPFLMPPAASLALFAFATLAVTLVVGAGTSAVAAYRLTRADAAEILRGE